MLRQQYGNDRVIFIGWNYEDTARTRASKFWYRLAFLLENTRYVRDQRAEQLSKRPSLVGYLNYGLVNVAASVLSRLSVARRLYRVLDLWMSPRHALHPYFEEYKPDLLFATDVFAEADSLVMREARSHCVPIAGMVRSWDNTTTKGILRLMPEAIIANSPIVEEELVRFHGYPKDGIRVVGLPQFDRWISGPTVSRGEFFKQIGADPSKRLILFAPAGVGLSNTDW